MIDSGGWNQSQVYNGKSCLNTVQISALLALDARRDLNRAAHYVKVLDELCCDVAAVCGDIQHSGGNLIFSSNS